MRTRNATKEATIRRKALDLFVKEGLDGFSMQKLARSARVSPATLYIYYRDRDDLIFQIYRDTINAMFAVTLEGFDPEMSLADGLKVQWRNRARYFFDHPIEAQFLEHIRHSPYIERFQDKLDPRFFEQMSKFAHNAIRRGEMSPMPRELFWSVAYAPLYQLIKFQQSGFGFTHRTAPSAKFQLTPPILDLALKMVVKGLKP